jgi:hypothetical protein
MKNSQFSGDLVDVGLVARAVLHGAQDGHPEQGVFYFGRPFTAPLDLQTAPGQIRFYAEERSGQIEFRRLVMNMNLCPKPGEPIRHVTVRAVIDAPSAFQEPVFRDVSPLRLTSTAKRSSKVGVKTNLLAVKPEAESESQYEREDPFLLARGVGTGQVQWEFRETRVRVLDGSFELLATLELPIGVAGNILISAAVSIRKKLVGIIGYQAQLPHDLAIVPFH